MKSERKYRGFSLTEVLLAVGTFGIGMIFVAGVFPVAIHFTTVATERTIAAVVADEAFAKIRLYGVVDFNLPGCINFNDVSFVNQSEFAYPSTDPDIMQKQYYWSALCRRVDPNSQLVQVTVFVSRKIGSGTMYVGGQNCPVLVPVSVSGVFGNRELTIQNPDEETFINDGYTIVDNETGDIYRVVERYADTPDTIELDRPWQGVNSPDLVWVVPPPVGGGRYPCITIYQRVIGF